MASKTFKTLHIWDTKFSADSVEWCPISPYKNYFTCGTYFLTEGSEKSAENNEEEECQRSGSITLFKVTIDKLELQQSINCSAVLDMKWSNKVVNDNIALATANAAGEVTLFYLKDDSLNFASKCSLKKDFGDYLILSLDWVKMESPDLICSSDSKGNLSLIKVAHHALQIIKTWKAHSLEAWTVCFDSFYPNYIYSGGDEAKMHIWDCRCEDKLKINSSSEHKAGITALNSNIYKENNLVSGSYDETVNFWDNRNWKSPSGTITASGGIWRLKWEPLNRSRYLLAACIYGGFQMYDVDTYSIAGEFKEHESLAYGADWCYFTKDELNNFLNCKESALIATCSFYDHKLCVSLWNEP